MIPILHPASILLAGTIIWLSAGSALAEQTSLLHGSPSDGLVFVRESAGGSELWRGRLSDGAVIQLTETPKISERRPQWSQAAQRLAFLARLEIAGLKTSQVRVMKIGASFGSLLSSKPDLIQLGPKWSPDGKQIAFTFNVSADRNGVRSGAAMVNLNTKVRRILVNGEGLGSDVTQLDFSPDGRQILMAVQHRRTRAKSILISHNGGIARSIVSKPERGYSFPRFTLDGIMILLSVDVEDSEYRHISIVSTRRRERTQFKTLAKAPGTDSFGAVPSPTRNEIVFVSDRGGSLDLYLLKLDKGIPINLTGESQADEVAPVWSPDGEMIAFRVRPVKATDTEPAKPSMVRVIGRNGSALFETEGTMPDWMPAWSTPAVKEPKADAKND